MNSKNRDCCDEYCPAVSSATCGLPTPKDIFEMLENREVWMCHCYPNLPCVTTGLEAVPHGYIPITDREF